VEQENPRASGMAQKIQFVVCIAQAKTINFDEPFSVLIP
jgi:ABC-type uncharacterized transport system ATPase subunit